MRNLAVNVILCALVACGANNQSQRLKTIQTALVAVNATRDDFVSYDKSLQTAIVAASPTAERGAQMLASYRNAREPFVDAFSLAYQALATAATTTGADTLAEALDSAKRLIEAFVKFKQDHLKPEPVKP